MHIIYWGDHRDQPRQPQSLGRPSFSLANAYREKRRQLVCENLYPLLEPLEPEMADKVIKMLLEMDPIHDFHLRQSRDVLKAKFAEAMELLRNTAVPNNNPVETDK